MRTLARVFRGHRGRTVAKLTVYSAGCLVVLAWLVSLIGNVAFFADRTGYSAELADVTGLFRNDAVKIAGVEVGKVTSIELERGRAVVHFEVEDDVELRRSTEVGVRWRNVLGQKYLYLYPGSEGPPLKGGDRLPLSQSVESAEVGDFLNALGPFLQALDPADVNAFNRAVLEALQGNDGRVRRLLDNTATLASALGSLDAEVGRSIGNLDQVLGALAERDDALDATVRNLATLSETLAARNDVLQDAVVQFAAVQARLRTLLQESRGDLDGTIANLESVAAVLAAHGDDLEQSLATLPEGLIGYHRLTRYGQWANVRSIVNCVAGQRTCDHGSEPHPPAPGSSRVAQSVASILSNAARGG